MAPKVAVNANQIGQVESCFIRRSMVQEFRFYQPFGKHVREAPYAVQLTYFATSDDLYR
jgi:hypothetical protein